MRKHVMLMSSMAVIMALAGCSGADPEPSNNWQNMNVQESPQAAPPPPADYYGGRANAEAAAATGARASQPSQPLAAREDSIGALGIVPTSAPGVAFNYRYAFRLPNNRIATVQEEHAQACEKLTITKCRITGMRYSLVDGDEVRAYLQFKLSPELARQFGKEGIAAVIKAEGMLVDSEISGNDEGTNINQSRLRTASINDRMKEIERRLASKGLADFERAQLQQQAASLRQQLANEEQNRSNSEEALANTPMSFHYGSGSTIPGFDGSSPLKESWRAAVGSFMMMLGVVLMAVGVSLPWLLLVGLLFALWRSSIMRGLRSWIGGGKAQTELNLDELAQQSGATSPSAAKE